MRTIIRFSVNQDSGSRLRNALAAPLHAAGLRRISTATYEGNIGEAQIRNGLNSFWNAVSSWNGAAHLDHFWMYSDTQDRLSGTDDVEDEEPDLSVQGEEGD